MAPLFETPRKTCRNKIQGHPLDWGLYFCGVGVGLGDMEKVINSIKKLNKLSLPVAILIGCFILGGFLYAIQINKQRSIEKVEAIQAKTEINQTKPIPVNSAIKIELCKTEAKDYADKIAKRAYLLASEKAQKAGDTATSIAYLEMSYEPKHPADYDSNYNSKYITCLKN